MICHFKAYGLVFLTVSTFCELQVACSNQESETGKSQGWTHFVEDVEEGEEGEGHHLSCFISSVLVSMGLLSFNSDC